MPTLTLRDIASSIDGEAKGNVDFTISHLSEAQNAIMTRSVLLKMKALSQNFQKMQAQ